jgi:hypothetical protein
MSDLEDLELSEPFDPTGYYSESRSSFGEDIHLLEPFSQSQPSENDALHQVFQDDKTLSLSVCVCV